MNGPRTPGEVLFTSAPNGETVLVRLADHFFRELQAFGVLTSSSVLTEEMHRAYVAARAGFILSFLETLSKFCDLRFAAHSRVPFCYNRAEWRIGVPVGGYTDTESEVLPTEVALSLVLNGQQRAIGEIRRRLLTCALGHLSGSGLSSTVTYLFDLHEAGFAGAEDVRWVTSLLLKAHSQAGSREALLERSIGRPASDEIDWLNVDPDLDWIRSAPLDGEGKAVLTSLFSRACRKIEEIRAAANLDDWVLGQTYLEGLLTAVRFLIEELVENVPLPWQARLAQWEEIACDAYALLRSSRAGYDMLSPEMLIGYATIMGATIRDRIGDGWHERLYRERLLIPARLREFFSAADENFPKEWTYLSWRVIHPWLIAVKRDIQPISILRTPSIPEMPEETLPGDGNEAYTEALLADVAAIHRLGNEHRWADAALRARSVLSRHPYMEILHVELAIALDHQNELGAALEELLTAVFLNPRNALSWHSMSVVMDRIGSRDEACFARAFADFLESQQPATDDQGDMSEEVPG